MELFHRLWRRRRVVAAVFLTTVALTVVALIVLPVRYLAIGSVIVAEQEPGISNVSAAWAQKIGDPADLESQLLVIRSPRVMRLAMAAPGVIDAVLQECRQKASGLLSGSSASCDKLKSDSAALIDYVQNRYGIAAAGRSRVINISYQSGIAEVAYTLANALTTAFLDDQRTAGSSSREVATSWLWQELKQLDAELREADAKIQTFRRNKGLMRGANAPISSERLTSISQQLSVAEAARADAAARLQEIKEGQARGSSSSAPAVLSSRAIADLKQQLTVISTQVASATSVLGPRHPSLVALTREQALIQQRLADEVGSIAASAQKAFDANDTLVVSLKKQLEAIKAEVGSATSDEASIESMVRGAEIKRQQYSDLYKRASELETERRVLLGSTRLVSLAEMPTKPFFPKKIPFLAAGLTLASLLSVAAALLLDRLDPRAEAEPQEPQPTTAPTAQSIVAATDAAPAAIVDAPPIAPAEIVAGAPKPMLSAVTGVPVLARLPRLLNALPASPIGAILKGGTEMSLRRALQLATHDDAVQAALEQLKSGLRMSQSNGRRRILVTSSGPAQGKTFATLALAQNLAADGHRVLAVEWDLLHPTFASALSLQPGPGLLAVLHSEAHPQAAVVRTAIPNLDVIAAGGTATDALDLLMSNAAVDLLSWSRGYDVVLIDGPLPSDPAGARIMACQVDDVLICMKEGSSSLGRALAATNAIRAAGGKISGFALTMVKAESCSDLKPEAIPDHQFARAV
uniref:Lipopolysaccharide biosynthesis n=1 Tax=Rhodopseudomonas palustris (strain BisA53) TaxID=316055 RepID=Q07TH1_RHOP5